MSKSDPKFYEPEDVDSVDLGMYRRDNGEAKKSDALLEAYEAETRRLEALAAKWEKEVI